jgi:YgiT-type zinc finger domain-containing protein
MTIEDIALLCKTRSIRWTGHMLERIIRRGISTADVVTALSNKASMTCFMCKGTLKDGLSTFTADMSGCIIVDKNVPSRICDQCSEASFSDEVTQRLEQIVQGIMKSASAEIAVVNYSDKAA